MVHKTCPECSDTLPVASKQCPCGYVFLAKKVPTKATERKVELVSSRLRPERAKKNYALHKSYIIENEGRKKGESGDNYESDEQDLTDLVQGSPYGDDDSPTYNPDSDRSNARFRNGQERNHIGKENSSSGSTESSTMGKVPGCIENGELFNRNAHNSAEEGNDSQASAPRRPRGRPKGSKDKKPRQPKGYRDMGLSTFSRDMTPSMDNRPGLLDRFDSMTNKRQRIEYGFDSCKRYLQPWRTGDKEQYVADVDPSTEIHMNLSNEKREIFKLVLEDINSKILRQNFKPE